MVPFLTTVLPILSGAVQVLSQFSGVSSTVAKATPLIGEAVGVITSLSPLLDNFSRGQTVTADDVRAALAGKDAALAEFDRVITQKSGT
jgi:hypothetical protein